MEYMPQDLSSTLISMANGTKNEICGVVLDDWTIITIANVSETPTVSFSMDFRGLIEAIDLADRSDRGILGIYHSHPGGRTSPSQRDVLGWPKNIDGTDARYWIITPSMVTEHVRHDDPIREGDYYGSSPVWSSK